jgi:predicted transcriptional regulator YdeE
MGAKLAQFTVKTFSKRRVIGKGVTLAEGEMTLEDTTIEDLWASMEKDGSLELLTHLPHQAEAQDDTVGWMGDFYPPDMHFTYLAGVMFEADTPAPEGFIYRDIEAGEMAVSWIQGMEGPEGGDLHADASGYNNRAMQEHGYEYDGSRGLFEMEYQSFERYHILLERGEEPILDFYSPCKKKTPAS